MLKLLNKRFPGKPAESIERICPATAVALGGCMRGAQLSRHKSQRSKLLKGKELDEIVPLNIGIGLSGGRFEAVIQRGMPIPTPSVVKFLTNELNNKRRIVFRIYETAGQLINDAVYLDELVFEYARIRTAGKTQIKFTMELDRLGNLSVTATIGGDTVHKDVKHSKVTDAQRVKEALERAKENEMKDSTVVKRAMALSKLRMELEYRKRYAKRFHAIRGDHEMVEQKQKAKDMCAQCAEWLDAHKEDGTTAQIENRYERFTKEMPKLSNDGKRRALLRKANSSSDESSGDEYEPSDPDDPDDLIPAWGNGGGGRKHHSSSEEESECSDESEGENELDMYDEKF